MSEKEIKVGDRVAVEDSRCSGIVTEIRDGRCKVRYPSGRVMNFPVEVLEHRDDPKTAFLTELSELIRKYNAKIRWSIGLTYEDRTRSSANIEVHTPNFDHYFSGETGVTLTADNVLNYDK